MSSFKNQIEEDVKEYQNNFPYIQHINKDEWVMDKLFNVDEELIEGKIID